MYSLEVIIQLEAFHIEAFCSYVSTAEPHGISYPE